MNDISVCAHLKFLPHRMSLVQPHLYETAVSFGATSKANYHHSVSQHLRGAFKGI